MAKDFIGKTRLGQFLRRGALLDEQKLFVQVVSQKKVQRFIVKLNTDQMRIDFMNSDGILLSQIGGGYSDYTMSKGKKSARENVDLYDEGDFHNSFRIEHINGDGFDITSDPIKSGGTNLLVEWGKEIEGLTFDNMRVAGEFMLGFYREKILKHLLG